MYYDHLQTMIQALTNIQGFLTKAEAFAETKGFDAANLLQARLAPDMFSLTRQIQASCDTAKFTAARLTGKTAPSFEDNEATVAELRTRIANTLEFLGTFTEADFAESAERHIDLPFAKGVYAVGQDYFLQFALPNFYFHVTTTYAILRANGVDLGKRDFIGALNMKPKPSA